MLFLQQQQQQQPTERNTDLCEHITQVHSGAEYLAGVERWIKHRKQQHETTCTCW